MHQWIVVVVWNLVKTLGEVTFGFSSRTLWEISLLTAHSILKKKNESISLICNYNYICNTIKINDLISFRLQKNKELMNDIITNCKIKNGKLSFCFCFIWISARMFRFGWNGTPFSLQTILIYYYPSAQFAMPPCNFGSLFSTRFTLSK